MIGAEQKYKINLAISYNGTLMKIESGVASSCSKEKCYHDHGVNIDIVDEAVRSLERGKLIILVYDHLIIWVRYVNYNANASLVQTYILMRISL